MGSSEKGLTPRIYKKKIEC